MFCSRDCAQDYLFYQRNGCRRDLNVRIRFWSVQCVICGGYHVRERKPFGAHLTCCRECDLVAKRKIERERFVSVKETNEYKDKTCPECGAGFSVNYYADVRVYCSDRCAVRVGRRSNRAKRRAAIELRTTGPVHFNEIVVRDKCICHLCGEPVDLSLHRWDDGAPELDHVIPLAQGGWHGPDNIKLSHRICNQRKGGGRGAFEVYAR